MLSRDPDDPSKYHEYFGGWLIKLPAHIKDGDKRTSITRQIGRTLFSFAPPSLQPFAYRKRFFVLDGNELRYYRDESLAQHLGTVDLGTVLDVRWADTSTRKNLHDYSFDLITDARTFTLAPADPDASVAKEWFSRIVYKIESSRKRGMLATSLRSSVVKKMAAAAARASQQQQLADSTSSLWLVGGAPALAPPLYLSHEACRITPDAVATAGAVAACLPAASSGAVASSGVAAIIFRESVSLAALMHALQARPGRNEVYARAAAFAAAEAASPRGLQALLMSAMASGGASSSAAMGVGAAGMLPPSSSTASTGPGGGQGDPASALQQIGSAGILGAAVGAVNSGAGGAAGVVPDVGVAARRGSSVFAAYDTSRLFSPIAATFGRPVAGFATAAASRVRAAVAAWDDTGVDAATGNPPLPDVRRCRRQAREVTRWEELSGNMPRWSLSFVNEHRLKHCAAFAPLLGLGPGRTGWHDGVSGRAGLAPALACIGAGETAAAASALGFGVPKKKTGKAAKKKKRLRERLKRKAKIEDEEEDDDDDDDDDLRGSYAEDSAEAAIAEVRHDAENIAHELADVPSAALFSSGSADADRDDLTVSPRKGEPSRTSEQFPSLRINESVSHLRQRVQQLLSTDMSSLHLNLDDGPDKGLPVQNEKLCPRLGGPALSLTNMLASEALASGEGLPAAHGRETDLLVALSSVERRHVAAMFEQLDMQRRLGWNNVVGRSDVPLAPLRFRQQAAAYKRPFAAQIQVALPVLASKSQDSATFGKEGTFDALASSSAIFSAQLRSGASLLRADAATPHRDVASSLFAHLEIPVASASHRWNTFVYAAARPACNRISRSLTRSLRGERVAQIVHAAALWPIQEQQQQLQAPHSNRKSRIPALSPSKSSPRVKSRSLVAATSPSTSPPGDQEAPRAPFMLSSTTKDEAALDFDVSAPVSLNDLRSLSELSVGGRESAGPLLRVPAPRKASQPLSSGQKQRAALFVARVNAAASIVDAAAVVNNLIDDVAVTENAPTVVSERRSSRRNSIADEASPLFGISPLSLTAVSVSSVWPPGGRRVSMWDWTSLKVNRNSNDAPSSPAAESIVGSADMLNGVHCAFALPPGHPALDVAGFQCPGCVLPQKSNDVLVADAIAACLEQAPPAVKISCARLLAASRKLGSLVIDSFVRVADAAAFPERAPHRHARSCRLRSAAALTVLLPAVLRTPHEISACVLVPRWFRPQVLLSPAAVAAAASAELASSFFAQPSTLRALWSSGVERGVAGSVESPSLMRELAEGVEIEVPLVSWGSRYGLPNDEVLNGWEDPSVSWGLPVTVALPPTNRGLLRQHAVPGSPDHLPWICYSSERRVSEEGSMIGENALLELDPWGDPNADVGDAFEALLGFFKMHNVAAGTTLFRAEVSGSKLDSPSSSRAPLDSPNSCDTGLLGSKSSVYIVLHGRVRFSFPPLPVKSFQRGEQRKGWKALKRAVSAASLFMKPSARDVLASSDADAAVTPARPLQRSSSSGGSTWNQATGSTAVADGSDAGRDIAVAPAISAGAPLPQTSAATSVSVGSLCAGMTVGTSCGNDRSGAIWVEISALASPLVIGLPTLICSANHRATVTVAEGSFLLELRPSAYAALCRSMPSAAAGLEVLASFWRPSSVVAAVPCLVTAFADTQVYPGWSASERSGVMSAVAALARPVLLSPGEALYNEGDPADCAYVVVAGRLAVSTHSSSAGTQALLSVCCRGSCVGESGLVLVGEPRAARATALSSAVLLRLSHDSLSAVLARYPRVWRAVRNAVVWRSAPQLVRLPLLSFLVGGESESSRLAPLTDLFGAVVLSPGKARSIVSSSLKSAAPADIAGAEESGDDSADEPASSAAAGAVDGDSLPRTAKWLLPVDGEPAGPAAAPMGLTGSLFLVAHGLVAGLACPAQQPHLLQQPTSSLSQAAGALPQLVCTALRPGEWLDAVPVASSAGSSAAGPIATAPCAVALPQTLSECISSAFARAAPPTPESLPPSSSSTTAVLLRLAPSSLLAFVSTLPAGPKRLEQWRGAARAAGGEI